MRALVAAALLALAWPGAAGAADLGGGTAPTNLRDYRRQLTIVSLHTGAGGSVVVRALVQARCGAGEIKRRTTIAADGSFAISTTERDRAPGDRSVRRIADVRVSGRIAGTAATGTAGARVRLVRGSRTVGRCTTSARPWQVRGAVAEAVIGPPRPSRGYFGLTGQKERPHAFMLHVDAAAKRVQAAVFDYALTCGGRRIEMSNVTPGGPIAADGTFSLRERFTLHFTDGIDRFRVKVDGRFTPAGVQGTLSVARDNCTIGRVAFAGAL
jgi:hypothetical protein